jgi:hypothetical protein
MIWTSTDGGATLPANRQFNGLVDAGTATDAGIILVTGGTWDLQIAENGAAYNWWPTPWGNFQTQIGGAMVDGFLDDWDLIQVVVQSGGFDWNLVDGWNMVSVPQDPVDKGGNGVFDSFDALNYCRWQTGTDNMALADRIGGNPSNYNVYDYLLLNEGLAFPMDSVHGYWVWSDTAAVCHFNSTNYTNWGVDNVVNAVAGWNLLGFTHNYTAWTTNPLAASFTDGTFGPDTGVAGNGKIVPTQWLSATQWYHSYVDTTSFPGMATHNWAWDNSYSTQPGSGFFLWLEAGATITFDVEY